MSKNNLAVVNYLFSQDLFLFTILYFFLRINIKIEGVLYPENAREKNDAVSS